MACPPFAEDWRSAGVLWPKDLFQTDLAQTQVITMYLLPEFNLQLRPRLLALAPGPRVVSHDWDMVEWLPEPSVTLDVPDKTIGRDKRSTVHLWVVPAQVQGLWCTAGGSVAITQRFQTFSATLAAVGAAAPVLVFDGRIAADTLHAGAAAKDAPITLCAEGNALQITRFDGPAALFPGRRFTRAGPQGCV